MKKFFVPFLHLMSVFLLLLSLSILHFAPKGGDVLAFLKEKNYLSSSDFDSAISESVNDIFDYIDLRNLFETRGTLDLNHTIAQSETNGATRSYSLDYLIKYARSMGYYLNEKNEIMEDGPATVSREQDEKEHQIRVIYRAYLPDYQPASPADGFMSLGRLSKEALGYLAKYYVAYSKDNYSTYYNNQAGVSAEQIQRLGKYLYTDSNSLELKTNLSTAPSNLVPLLEAREPYSEGSYVFSAGVDTSFPYEDLYKAAYLDYSRRRQLCILGLLLFMFSIISWISSFVFLLYFAGRGQKQELLLYPFDKSPMELTVLLGFIWYYFSALLAKSLIESLVPVVGTIPEQDFFRSMSLFLIRYLVLLPLFLSLVRQYKKSLLYSSSYIKRILKLLETYITASQFTRSKAFSYFLFVLPNLLALGLILYNGYCFIHRRSLLHLLIAILLIFVCLSIDYYTYFISRGLQEAVNEQVKAERLKADLITNVSHDLKTPLTSIISYVDLLKRENIEDKRIQGYIEVLDQKAGRLKNLTEDLVEASKASSGNINLELYPINYNEILLQTLGEFQEKLDKHSLQIISSFPDEEVVILADGRQLFRVLENLFNNCAKYALPGSRVYIALEKREKDAVFTMKNISEAPLNISPNELTERFVRGDVSRSTEGSGLGLSIAKSLTKLMSGKMIIEIDGDLYKVSLIFPLMEQEEIQ